MSYFSVKDFTTAVAAKIKSFVVNTDENIPTHGILDSAGAEVLGTLTASPTANTIGARLKSIVDALAGTLTVASHAVTNAGTFAVQSTEQATEVHLGEIGGKTVVKTIAMSTDTNVYASGDLVADTQQLDAAFRVSNGTGVLNTLTIIDQDAQGVALYVMFHYTSTTLGSENSAPNISDANLAAGLQGIVAVATTDYVTVSGAKVACIKNIGLPLKAASGTDDLYVSVLNGTGTPTYTATGLNFALGILQD